MGGECVQVGDGGVHVLVSQPDSVLEEDVDIAGAHSGDITKP